MILTNAWVIAKKDFKTYFGSPLSYILIGMFSLVLGWMFYAILSMYIQQSMQFQQFGMGNRSMSVSENVLRPLFGNLSVILLFIIPFLTARLVAEEKRQNTFEMVLTSPTSMGAIIFGKFLAALMFTGLFVLSSAPFIVVLAISTNPDWGVVALSYLGVLMMSSVFLSIGIFFSSLTDSQIVAGILSFAFLLFLWVIKWITLSLGSGSAMGEVISYLSVIDHFEEFSKGVLNTKDIIFYLSASFFFLFASVKSIESQSWRS